MSDLSRKLIEVACSLQAELEREDKAVVGVAASDLIEFADLMKQAAEVIEKQHDATRQHYSENPISLDNMTLGFLMSLLLWRDFSIRKREVGSGSAQDLIRQDLSAIKERLVSRRTKAMCRLTPGLNKEAMVEHLEMICDEVIEEFENVLKEFF